MGPGSKNLPQSERAFKENHLSAEFGMRSAE